MRKFLSIVLSMAMLLTTVGFAAPVAVMPESAEEFVIRENYGQDAVNDAVNDAVLNSGMGDPYSVKYGTRVDFNDFDDYETAPASNNPEITTAELVENGDGKALKISCIADSEGAAFSVVKARPAVSNEADYATFEADKYDYTMFVEVLDYTGSQMSARFGNSWYWLIDGQKAFGKSGYSETIINSDSVFRQEAFGTGNVVSGGIYFLVTSYVKDESITIDNYGIYRKPLERAVAVSVTNPADSTVTVTYPEGIYADSLNAILADPAIIDGVTAAEQVGNSIVFTVERDKDIVIPELVNEDGTATYNEVNANVQSGDVFSVKYGIREMLVDFDGEGAAAPTESGVTTELVANGDGKALKITHTGESVYAFLPVNSSQVTFDVEANDYTLFAQTLAASGTLSVSFGSNWQYIIGKANEGEKASFGDSGYSVITLTSSDQFGAGVNKETGTTNGYIYLGVNPADKDATKTLDNIGIYYKPKTKATASSVVDIAAGTVTVAYPDGIYADSLNAILADPTIIDGVTAVQQVGNSLVFTVERYKAVVIPSLVNESATATYNEVDVNIQSGDAFSVKYGVREMLVDFDEDGAAAPASTECTTSELVDNGSGKALKLTSVSNSGYSFFKINNKNITFDVENYDYTLFAETLAASGKFDMSFANNWTYLLSTTLNEGEKRGFADSGYSVITITSTAQFGSGAFNGNTTNSPIHLIVNPSEAGTSKTLDNIGIYKKPKQTASASSVVDVAAGTVTVTYTDGVYSDSLNAILTDPTIIDGVTAAEQSGNSIVFTVERDKEIVIPALVNESATATYNKVNVNIQSGDVFSVKYGIREMLVDFDDEGATAPSGGAVTNTLVPNGDGKALKITHTGSSDYAFFAINGSKVIFDVEKYDYTLFAETVASNGTLSVGFGSNNWAYLIGKVNQGESSSFADSGYREITLTSKEQFGGGISNKETGETSGAVYLGVNPAQADASKTIDNIGIYYKPKKDIKVTSVVNNAADTLEITYSSGVYSETIKAVLADPTLVGAKSASYSDCVLTLTADNLNSILVPAFVNEAMDATYCEVRGVAAPIGTEKGIRTNVTDYGMGVRYVAKVNQTARYVYSDENIEYGTLVTLEKILEAANLTSEGLTFEAKENGVNIISKESFGNGANDLHDVVGEYDFFSAAFVNIPKDVDSYKMKLVFRPYVKYKSGDITNVVYGKTITGSPYTIAKELVQVSTGKLKEYCQQIVDACDGVQGVELP